jgi:hypothetical protein
MLWDLFALAKPMDNTKSSTTQVVDIFLRNWFSIDLTFIVLDFEEEDEGATRAPPKIQVIRSTRVLGLHFQCALIDLIK